MNLPIFTRTSHSGACYVFRLEIVGDKATRGVRAMGSQYRVSFLN